MESIDIGMIVAVDEGNVIGNKGRMPWYIPAELKYFKQMTQGKVVIMGRKTFESIGRKPLPGRHNIVVSRTMQKSAQGGEVVAASLSEAMDLAREHCNNFSKDEIIVMGGAELYTEALPLIKRLYLTRIHGKHEGDTFLPELNMVSWRCLRSELKISDDQEVPNFTVSLLERI
jgi:dihydrofolate reductase